MTIDNSPATALNVRLHSLHTSRGVRYFATFPGLRGEVRALTEREWRRRMSIEADTRINKRGAPVQPRL